MAKPENGRILLSVLYAVTALCMAGFFDGLYAGEPITRHRALIYLASGSLGLFLAASVLSFFKRKVGLGIGLLAAILAWPFFAIQLAVLPWYELSWYLRYRFDSWTTLLTLIVSSIFTLAQIRSLVRTQSAT